MSWSASILLGVGCLVGAAAADTFAADRPVDDRFSGGLQAELAAGAPPFDVIVHLEGSPEASLAIHPFPSPAEHARRDAVATIVTSELSDLHSELSDQDQASLRPFQLQPAYAASLSREGLMRVSRRARVRHIERDLRWSAHTSEGLPMIGALQLHELGFTGEGTAVAIIDTGIDSHHPSLGAGAIPNPKVVRGLDTADLDDDPSDCGGHGTAVASIAAGTSYQWSPQRRFAGGVAPQAKILAYKASPDADCGSFQLSAVVAAIEDAVLHRQATDWRLVAINLSLGGGAYEGPCDELSPSLANAMALASQAGIAVVASAGNEGVTGGIAAPACLSDVLGVASVWDTDAGWIGFSFCLDPQCTKRCDDSFRPAGAITCYSNSGVGLGLLAPSEYLKAASAGGQTLEFGGTSGAAAYATGAIALLGQAATGMDPISLTRVLQLTGHPTLDARNGLVRPRLSLDGALSRLPNVYPSPGPAVTIPPSPTTTTSSAVVVNSTVTVGSIRVLLHLVHPQPERLQVALVSAAGSRALLHDHGASSIPATGDVANGSGLWGLYPDEIEPADSLGRFAGESAAGVWTLEVFDRGSPTGSGTTARLAGWALEIVPAEPPAAVSAPTVIPVVAHAAGALGTHWTSEVRILNPSSDRTAPARLYFVPSSADGTETFFQTELVLPQQSVVALADVVAARFASAAPRGSLVLQSQLDGLVVTSRTAAESQQAGTYGQFIAAANPAHTAGLDEPPLVIADVGGGDGFRTNIGLTEITGREVTVSLTRHDGQTGEPLAPPIIRRLSPWSNLQLAAPDEEFPFGYATVAAVAGTGRASAYASIVDNRSGDAVFVPAVRPDLAQRLFVPVVARQSGRSGTLWRSSLRIVNAGTEPALLQLTFSPERGQSGASRTISVTIDPGRQIASEDAVLELFQLEHGLGSLRIDAPDQPALIAVSSRAFNNAAHGTFGQRVGATRSGSGQRASLSHVDGSPDRRTNLGLVEVGAGSARVRATLRDSFGRRLGHPVAVDLLPLEMVQIDDVFAAAEAPQARNAQIELELLAGPGEFFGYASVVDAVTGDAIFVPAHSIAP